MTAGAWQVCDQCGAVVFNFALHATWHSSLTPTPDARPDPAPAVTPEPVPPVVPVTT